MHYYYYYYYGNLFRPTSRPRAILVGRALASGVLHMYSDAPTWGFLVLFRLAVLSRDLPASVGGARYTDTGALPRVAGSDLRQRADGQEPCYALRQLCKLHVNNNNVRIYYGFKSLRSLILTLLILKYVSIRTSSPGGSNFLCDSLSCRQAIPELPCERGMDPRPTSFPPTLASGNWRP